MGQQFVGGLLRDGRYGFASPPTTNPNRLGPALGGMIALPLARPIAGAIHVKIKMPFALAFVGAVATSLLTGTNDTCFLSVNGAGNTFYQEDGTLGAESAVGINECSAANNPIPGIPANGAFFSGPSGVSTVTKVRGFTTSTLGHNADFRKNSIIELLARNLNRGDFVTRNTGFTSPIFTHCSHILVIPRGAIFDSDNTQDGQALITPELVYNASND